MPLERQRVRPHGVQLAQPAGQRQLVGQDEVRLAAPLHAGLEDPPVALRRLHELTALGHRHGAGFLGIDILARAHRVHGHRRVPAVAGRHHHRVEVVARQQFPEVRMDRAAVAAVALVHRRLRALAPLAVHVADGHDLHVRLLERHGKVVRAAPAHADVAHDDPLAGRQHAAPPEGGSRHDHRRGPRRPRRARRHPQKSPAGYTPPPPAAALLRWILHGTTFAGPASPRARERRAHGTPRAPLCQSPGWVWEELFSRGARGSFPLRPRRPCAAGAEGRSTPPAHPRCDLIHRPHEAAGVQGRLWPGRGHFFAGGAGGASGATVSASRDGSGGNFACGSVWYQNATEAMSSWSGR